MPNTSTQKQIPAGRLLPIHWQDCAWGTNIRLFARVDWPCPRRSPQSRRLALSPSVPSTARFPRGVLLPTVAPTGSRLYRRLAIGSLRNQYGFRRLTTGDTVECHSSLRTRDLGHTPVSSLWLYGGAHTRAHKARRPNFMFTRDPAYDLLRLSALPLGSFPFSRLQIRHLFQANAPLL